MIPIYDDYHEEYFTELQTKAHLARYLKWCELNNQSPEVESLIDVNEDNISHIIYHSNLLD